MSSVATLSQEGREWLADEARERRFALGLSDLATSVTPPPQHYPEKRQRKQRQKAPRDLPNELGQVLEIDPRIARVNRMQNRVSISARVLMDEVERKGLRGYWAFITLTYEEIAAWRPYHITQYLRRCNVWLKRRGHVFRYVWVAELQKRGAVHYHIVTWLPHRVKLPKPDELREGNRMRWWSHGSSNIKAATSPLGYIMKYASKGEDVLVFPKGLRLYGAGGLEESDRAIATWTMLPGCVRAVSAPGERVERIKGVGHLIPSTGAIVQSPWKLAGFTKGGHLVLRNYSSTSAEGPGKPLLSADGVRGSEVADSAKLPPMRAAHPPPDHATGERRGGPVRGRLAALP